MLKNIVRLENSFAEHARYSLRTRSQALFLYLISMVDTRKSELEDIVLHVTEIEKILKQAKHSENKIDINTIKWGNFNEEIKPYLEELKSCTFTIPSNVIYKGKTLPTFTDLFSKIEACKLNGKASYRFIFSFEMKSFLLELERYVQFKWISAVNIKNVHGVRLYIALKAALEKQKRHRAIVNVTFKLQELRDLFRLDDDITDGNGIVKEKRYSKTNDFKRYVIEKAVQEITQKSDINVVPSYIKRGRNLDQIIFQVTESKYNPNQLKLALVNQESKEYKFLQKLSKMKYSEVPLDKVKLVIPSKYVEIIDETALKFEHEDYQGYINALSKEQVEDMKQNHIKSEFIQYARSIVD